MGSYEQTLKLFSRWLKEHYEIENAEEVKEPHIRAYICIVEKIKDEHIRAYSSAMPAQ